MLWWFKTKQSKPGVTGFTPLILNCGITMKSEKVAFLKVIIAIIQRTKQATSFLCPCAQQQPPMSLLKLRGCAKAAGKLEFFFEGGGIKNPSEQAQPLVNYFQQGSLLLT